MDHQHAAQSVYICVAEQWAVWYGTVQSGTLAGVNGLQACVRHQHVLLLPA